eukprot:CAMPEP_0115063752 /NCGR_PEP_ID=MMETSP0227-20121206/9284_1 /TAXON_ID=89957 /ORGANISM="Polarella glacialis, Strain CCMP 1383" /LENGTH=249 /DNA_ID=CAMNT_0002449293 /DNA_START=65 /DNA_END=811 /DNA_ORIENTATION=-
MAVLGVAMVVRSCVLGVAVNNLRFVFAHHADVRTSAHSLQVLSAHDVSGYQPSQHDFKSPASASSPHHRLQVTTSEDAQRSHGTIPSLRSPTLRQGSRSSVSFASAATSLTPETFALGLPHWIISVKSWFIDHWFAAMALVRRSGIDQCSLHWFAAMALGAVSGLLIIPAFFFALALIGFTTGGVVAGSLAACCQAQAGSVAGGSCFALGQSIAALGVRAACTPPVLMAGSVAGVAISQVLMYFYSCTW